MKSPPILEIADVSLSYTTRGRMVRALQAVNLSIGDGEAVGLVGESGSGKSTVARAALGLTPANVARIESGKIRVAGRDVTELSEAGWATLRGHPTAMVFQDPLS